jgi:hypothetical protein
MIQLRRCREGLVWHWEECLLTGDKPRESGESSVRLVVTRILVDKLRTYLAKPLIPLSESPTIRTEQNVVATIRLLSRGRFNGTGVTRPDVFSDNGHLFGL